MSQSTERIVVFVTAAEKRAIAGKAAGLGVSVSELLRRAMLAYGETANEVRAARIVDHWRGPVRPDELGETLQRIAAEAQLADGWRPSEASDTEPRHAPLAPGPEASITPADGAPIPVPMAVVQALAQADPPDERDSDGLRLDLETVARLTANWSSGNAVPGGATPDMPDTDGRPAPSPARAQAGDPG